MNKNTIKKKIQKKILNNKSRTYKKKIYTSQKYINKKKRGGFNDKEQFICSNLNLNEKYYVNYYKNTYKNMALGTINLIQSLSKIQNRTYKRDYTFISEGGPYKDVNHNLNRESVFFGLNDQVIQYNYTPYIINLIRSIV
jgi:oligoribonuclease NrnB/cAMP/cGMP phosphodiesterase (DHH superfamily)